MPPRKMAFTDLADKASESLRLCACGLAQGEVYVGVEQNLFSTVKLQFGGGRLLACARPSEVPWLHACRKTGMTTDHLLAEVLEFSEATSLKDALQFMKDMDPEKLPAGSVPSFMVGNISANDAVFLPMGCLFVEKAINANSICAKVSQTWSWCIIRTSGF